jgi:hypothetical protein
MTVFLLVASPGCKAAQVHAIAAAGAVCQATSSVSVECDVGVGAVVPAGAVVGFSLPGGVRPSAAGPRASTGRWSAT